MACVLGVLLFVCLAAKVRNANSELHEDPCNNYQELSGADRAASYTKLTGKSDGNRSWTEDWYRFTGEAGNQLASLNANTLNGGKCLEPPSCGAKYPGVLRTPHPKYLRVGAQVQGTVCFAKTGDCCYKNVTATIMKCQRFWVYLLPPASAEKARYCGKTVRGTKPVCNEKKLLYGLNKQNAAKSCKEIKKKRTNAASGIYWINPSGNEPIQAFCDQETDGGGWTLVYSYTFTNFKNFRSASNANTPRPNWPTYGDVPVSTTAPLSETDYNAMDFSQWKNLGDEFMIKSNINHWIACQEGTGSLMKFVAGSVKCRIIKNVAYKCYNHVPDQLILITSGNPNGFSVGPDLIRSRSTTGLKEYYYFDGDTRTNWPTHDPCGTNSLNHLTHVANPHGNIYIRG